MYTPIHTHANIIHSTINTYTTMARKQKHVIIVTLSEQLEFGVHTHTNGSFQKQLLNTHTCIYITYIAVISRCVFSIYNDPVRSVRQYHWRF